MPAPRFRPDLFEFIAALKDLTEVWEIQYADEPVYYGRVHDYRVEGAPKVRERFPVRRIRLDDYLDDFFFDPPYQNLVGAARNGRNGQVVSLLVGRKIADIDLTARLRAAAARGHGVGAGPADPRPGVRRRLPGFPRR